MTERTENARFFFLTPRLLRHRQSAEMNQCYDPRATQPVPERNTLLECSVHYGTAEADIGKHVEHYGTQRETTIAICIRMEYEVADSRN